MTACRGGGGGGASEASGVTGVGGSFWKLPDGWDVGDLGRFGRDMASGSEPVPRRDQWWGWRGLER